MKRTAIYCRVSTARQEKEGDSIPAQLDALREYIRQRDDLIPAGEYVDAGISGTKEDRDELQRMLDDVRAGKIDLIICTKLDRLHRSLRNFLNMQSVLEKHNCNWLAIWEPIYDSSTPQGRMIINTMVNLAQFEAENTGSRIRQVFEYKAQQGEILSGKVLYGYQITDKHLTIDPTAAPIVRALFDEYAKNNSLSDAVRLAGELGRMTDIRSMKRLLKNRKYIGEYRGNPNYCPPIIERSVFDAVQIGLARNIKQSQKRTYIFSGLLVCAECGRKMAGTNHATRRNGKEYPLTLYRCNGHYSPMVHCSQSRTISETTIEKSVLKAVKAEVDKITIEQSKPRQKGAQRATAAKEKAIQRKLERLKAAYLNGAIPLDEYKTDREQLTEELTALKASEPRNTAPAVRLDKVFTSDFETVYKALNASERRRLWRSVIKEIRMDDGKNLDIIFL